MNREIPFWGIYFNKDDTASCQVKTTDRLQFLADGLWDHIGDTPVNAKTLPTTKWPLTRLAWILEGYVGMPKGYGAKLVPHIIQTGILPLQVVVFPKRSSESKGKYVFVLPDNTTVLACLALFDSFSRVNFKTVTRELFEEGVSVARDNLAKVNGLNNINLDKLIMEPTWDIDIARRRYKTTTGEPFIKQTQKNVS